MIIYRALFILLALGLSYITCKYLSLDLYQYLTVMAFIVAMDTAFVRWVSLQYMKAVVNTMQPPSEKENK